MGLGPSIKMTTLHHYNCPVTQTLLSDKDINFRHVIVTGVSESYDDKINNATQTASLASSLNIDGALVAIDGWGNHHIDFVQTIEQLGMRDIPSVGLSFLGNQGQLVCSNPYVRTIIDFNKSTSGYESCVVGQNNLTKFDAWKALGLLKYQIKQKKTVKHIQQLCTHPSSLTKHHITIKSICQSDHLYLENTNSNSQYILHVNCQELVNSIKKFCRIHKINISIVKPDNKHFFVNSNLDFQPIAWKSSGSIGFGSTYQLDGVTVMLTGVENTSKYQPANIGSSEGVLSNQVKFNQAGTPQDSDFLLHIDCIFKEGEGRTAEGIIEAHTVCDQIIESIRSVLRKQIIVPTYTEIFRYQPFLSYGDVPNIALIKLVSGLGNMYDTSLFPSEPCGFCGSTLLRQHNNSPVQLTGLECLDGAIHSLI